MRVPVGIDNSSVSARTPRMAVRHRHASGRAPLCVAVVVLAGMAVGACSSSGSSKHAALASKPTSSIASPGNSGGARPAGQIPDIVTKVEPSVVTIITQQGLGSGIVYRADGEIVTDAHVIEGATQVEVAFADGKRIPGTVQASDKVVDLAVVHVDRTNLPVAHFQQTLPRVGALAVALGSPLGFQETVTAGIISGLHREIPGSAQQSAALVDLMQTDAPISPGNSGGAVVDANGDVVGISEAYIPPSAGAVAIGFATPAATVVLDVEQLLKSGHAEHAFAGIQPTDLTAQIAQQLGVAQSAGIAVLDVVASGPAAKAGVQPGDVISSMATVKVTNVEDFVTELRKLHPGQTVPLVVNRSGTQSTLTLTLTDRP